MGAKLCIEMSGRTTIIKDLDGKVRQHCQRLCVDIRSLLSQNSSCFNMHDHMYACTLVCYHNTYIHSLTHSFIHSFIHSHTHTVA